MLQLLLWFRVRECLVDSVRAASYVEIRDFGKFEYTVQRLINFYSTILWIRVNITLLADYAGKLQGM
jgi:hypothetical protein